MATETLCDDVILAVAPRQVPILINIFIFGSKYRKKKKKISKPNFSSPELMNMYDIDSTNNL